jgi:hypothetical protein
VALELADPLARDLAKRKVAKELREEADGGLGVSFSAGLPGAINPLGRPERLEGEGDRGVKGEGSRAGRTCLLCRSAG